MNTLHRALLITTLAVAAVASIAAAPRPARGEPPANGATVTPNSATSNARTFAVAVRSAIEDAEADLARMPFFVRPMAKSGFARRTGLSFDAWRERLGPVRTDDTPASLKSRWPDVEIALGKLVENFKGAPERAKKGMGGNAEVIAEVTRRSAERAAATQAMLDWLRR